MSQTTGSIALAVLMSMMYASEAAAKSQLDRSQQPKAAQQATKAKKIRSSARNTRCGKREASAAESARKTADSDPLWKSDYSPGIRIDPAANANEEFLNGKRKTEIRDGALPKRKQKFGS